MSNNVFKNTEEADSEESLIDIKSLNKKQKIRNDDLDVTGQINPDLNAEIAQSAADALKPRKTGDKTSSVKKTKNKPKSKVTPPKPIDPLSPEALQKLGQEFLPQLTDVPLDYDKNQKKTQYTTRLRESDLILLKQISHVYRVPLWVAIRLLGEVFVRSEYCPDSLKVKD